MTNEDPEVTELSAAPTARLTIRYSPVNLIESPTEKLRSSNEKISLPDEIMLAILEMAIELEPRMIRLDCHHDKFLKTIILSDSPAPFHVTWKLRKLLLTEEVMLTYKPYFRLPESCFSAETDTLHISTQLYTMLRTEAPWMHNFRHMFEHVKRLSLDHTPTDQSVFLSLLRLDIPRLEEYSVRFDTVGARQNLTDGGIDRWVETYQKLGRELNYTMDVRLDEMMSRRGRGVIQFYEHEKFPFGHVSASRLPFLRSASRMSREWIPPGVSKTRRGGGCKIPVFNSKGGIMIVSSEE
ncbi:hypothetical protein BGAL_0047g00400 [Botrytis galanthina]|uniref:Uncharacterized protein n=1 Tax=Botrytis galanthina TaxID=278940 RepID=A0A4V4HVK3_9HELO|nr:hypothetical protein BGAL_0047g00400 [Botrytis galanthina]